MINDETGRESTTKLYDKYDDFDFFILNLPPISCNISQSPSYELYLIIDPAYLCVFYIWIVHIQR